MKKILLISAVIVVAVFLNKYFLNFRINFYPKSLVNVLHYSYAKLENFGKLAKNIENFRHLAAENEELKKNQRLLLSLRAQVDKLQSENEILRKAINIAKREQKEIIDGGIFNVSFGPEGYNILLNKGSRDGIKEGDTVVTPEGALVGRVQKVNSNFSGILFVYDPKFKVTAKIIGSRTAGIARGALNEGMYLDLVAQDDAVMEGDVLVTSGDDMFSAGLVIGKVDYVESNENELFKGVRIKPAVKSNQMSKVLIIKQ